MIKSFQLPKLVVSILACLSAGVIGSFFTYSAIPTWYEALNKPSFNPPNFIFGPVWIVLYILMGISLYLVWEKGLTQKDVKLALVIFAIHLIFNAAWSFIFFGLRNPQLAFFEIVILWFLIVFVMVEFYEINKLAALIFLPYIAWVSFATILNFSIWMLN